jgi:hypothetical protein
MKIIRNMGVLAECKDARDQHTVQERHKDRPRAVIDAAMDDLYNEAIYLMDEDGAYAVFEHSGGDPDVATKVDDMPNLLDSAVGIECRKALYACLRASNHHIPIKNVNKAGFEIDITAGDSTQIKAHAKTMGILKRKRRPDFERIASGLVHKKASHHNRNPETDIAEICSVSPVHNSSAVNNLPVAVNDIISDMQMWDNEEQLRAFQIVARHVLYGGSQLLMYIGGVGGTGKSHLIHAIIRLFDQLGRRHKLMLSAPTGIAAVLIGGHTIHALTMLPQKS